MAGRLFENRHGSLEPVRLASGGDAGDTLVSSPVPSPVNPGPQDYRPFYPPGFYPDASLNIRHGGRPFWLQPENYPVLLGAAGSATERVNTRLVTDMDFAQFVIASTFSIEATAGQNIGVKDSRYLVDIKRRRENYQDQIDSGFVAIQSVFGVGEYQHWWKMPMLIGPGSVLSFELLNRAPVAVAVRFQFLVLRQKSQECM